MYFNPVFITWWSSRWWYLQTRLCLFTGGGGAWSDSGAKRKTFWQNARRSIFPLWATVSIMMEILKKMMMTIFCKHFGKTIAEYSYYSFILMFAPPEEAPSDDPLSLSFLFIFYLSSNPCDWLCPSRGGPIGRSLTMDSDDSLEKVWRFLSMKLKGGFYSDQRIYHMAWIYIWALLLELYFLSYLLSELYILSWVYSKLNISELHILIFIYSELNVDY